MTTATVHSSTSPSTPHEIPAKSRIGLVVATCLLGGLALGLLLVLGLFAGRDEPLTIACALFALGTVLADVLIFSLTPLYPAYRAQPHRVFWLSPLHDQQLAGLVMTVEQLLALGVLAAVLLVPELRRLGSAARQPAT